MNRIKSRAVLIIVSPDDLVGVTDDPQKFAWLRENFEPIDTVAYVYLIYDVSPQDLDQLCKTKSICLARLYPFLTTTHTGCFARTLGTQRFKNKIDLAQN